MIANEEVKGKGQAKPQPLQDEQLLLLALKAGEVGSWKWDLASDTVRWSENLEAIYGMRPGEFDGRFESFIQAVHPEDREMVLTTLKQALEEKEPFHFQHRCLDQTGRVNWLECKGQVIRGEAGQVAGMTGTCMNITLRKQNEHSNALLRAIVDSSDDAIISKNLDGTIMSWNASAERMFGYTAKQAIGQPITMLISADRREEETEILGRLKRGERVEHFETIRLRKDGTMVDVSLTVSPIRDAEGQIVGTSKIARDITDRKKAQEYLRSSEERFRTMMERSPLSMQIFDAEGRTIAVNSAWERLWNTSREELAGYNILKDEQLQAAGLTSHIQRAFNGEVVRLPEVYYDPAEIGKPGRARWIEGYIYPLVSREGETIEVALVHHDITERKQTQKQLEAINETLEERVEERTSALLSYQDQLRWLAVELSKAEERERQRLATELHDHLGQTLTMCKMKLDLLQRSELPDHAASGADELSGLMDDAIRYTRELMSDLKPPPSLDKEDLKTALCWVAEKMGKHDLNVTIKDDGRPKPLSKERRSMLLQSVRELLFNVVKHAGVDEAAVVLTRTDSQLQVSVEDNGRGFNRENTEPTPTEEGGFGLFSIRERIDLLGGSLNIISRPGKGTRVMLMMPLQDKTMEYDVPGPDDKQSGISRPGSPAKPGNSQIINVLLAEDHRMVRTGLRTIIEEEDDMKVVAEASNGREAVELARKTSPDVIIMDVNMPIMNGIEATRQITSDAPHMHIIGLSLHDRKDVAQAMRKAGASAYLTKGEVFETLCATIRSKVMMVKE